MGVNAVVFKSLAADFTSIPPTCARKGAEIAMVTGGKFYRNRSSLRCLRNKIPGHIGATGVLHCSEPPEELNNRINLS